MHTGAENCVRWKDPPKKRKRKRTGAECANFVKKPSRLDSGFFSATVCIARSSPPWIIVLLEKLNQGSSRRDNLESWAWVCNWVRPWVKSCAKVRVELWKNDDKMHQNKIYVVGGRVGTRKTKARWADPHRYPSIFRRRTATRERTPVMPKEPGSLFTSTPSPGVALLKNGEWRYIFTRCRYYFKNEDASSLLRTNVRRRYNLSLRVTHTFWTCVFLCLFTKTPDDAKKKQRYNQDT